MEVVIMDEESMIPEELEEEEEEEWEQEPVSRFVVPPQPQQISPIPVPVEPEKKGDGISDLFEVTKEDIDDDSAERVTVDVERDIIDADEGGGLEDLVEVTEEDIMGDEMYGQTPLEGASKQRRMEKRYFVRPRRITPPPTMGGLRV